MKRSLRGTLAGSAEAAAEQTVAGMVGGLFSSALGWVKSFFKTQKFAINFLQDMRARAEEIPKRKTSTMQGQQGLAKAVSGQMVPGAGVAVH